MTLPYMQHWQGGCLETGTAREAARLRESLAPTLVELDAKRKNGDLPFLSLPARRDDLPAILEWAARTRARFDRLIVLGTGGSSLGGQTLLALAHHPLEISRVQFIDNVDPQTIDAFIAATDWKRTALLAVSKSGGTVEMLCQLYTLHAVLVSKIGRENAGRAVTAVTGPGPSALRRFAEAEGAEIFTHDPKLGGRFSVFSEVGLLSSAFAGLDIAGFRAGAQAVVEDAFTGQGGVVAEGAAMAVALMRKAYKISVLMAYCDRLRHLGNWYRQTWAESVGKDGKGTTPVPALGTVDQHSQLQLYLDGPRDKFFTLLMAERGGQGPVIPVPEGEESLGYLRGHHIGDVMAAHGLATAETLANKGLPVRLMACEKIDERSLGAMLMHFMLETVFACALLGVNAFDQPAVEESKRLARVYLAR